MYRFHLAIHARPDRGDIGPDASSAQGNGSALKILPSQLSQPFGVSFEQVLDALQRLPRMFVEPDGSFVWVSPDPALSWQVDGQLFDRQDRLLYVELKGTCPRVDFDRLLGALGWPETALIFQLVRQAKFLDEAAFRRVAEMT